MCYLYLPALTKCTPGKVTPFQRGMCMVGLQQKQKQRTHMYTMFTWGVSPVFL